MEQGTVKFAAFTDLHLDIMHDGARRLDAFLNAAEQEDVDFIIHLGDFSYPEDTSCCKCDPQKMPVNLKLAMKYPPDVPKKELLARFSSFPKPAYHMLGNHEMDFSTKDMAMELYGMTSPYYAFHCNGWHFIVLDGNHCRNAGGEIVDYWYGKYFETTDLPYLGDPQLAWLEQELLDGQEPVVLLCHQPMRECPRGLKDRDALLDLIQQARMRGKIVRLCMNGHLHEDLLYRENGVVYYTLNSISNYWAGLEYETLRYSKKIDTLFPNLRYTLPYQKPIYAIITLDRSGMDVRGIQGRFVQPGPLHTDIRPMPTASIRNRHLEWPEAR